MSSSGPRRLTAQRAAIHRALEAAGGFRTAQELHAGLVGEGHRVGLATVYRELQSRVASGEVDSLVNLAGETIFRLCASEDHHHHLVCRECGASVEIESREVEEWAQQAANSHGFSSVVHVAELYGLCDDCGKLQRGSGS